MNLICLLLDGYDFFLGCARDLQGSFFGSQGGSLFGAFAGKKLVEKKIEDPL